MHQCPHCSKPLFGSAVPTQHQVLQALTTADGWLRTENLALSLDCSPRTVHSVVDELRRETGALIIGQRGVGYRLASRAEWDAYIKDRHGDADGYHIATDHLDTTVKKVRGEEA